MGGTGVVGVLGAFLGRKYGGTKGKKKAGGSRADGNGFKKNLPVPFLTHIAPK